jgi:hypothetical protein
LKVGARAGETQRICFVVCTTIEPPLSAGWRRALYCGAADSSTKLASLASFADIIPDFYLDD